MKCVDFCFLFLKKILMFTKGFWIKGFVLNHLFNPFTSKTISLKCIKMKGLADKAGRWNEHFFVSKIKSEMPANASNKALPTSKQTIFLFGEQTSLSLHISPASLNITTINHQPSKQISEYLSLSYNIILMLPILFIQRKITITIIVLEMSINRNL